LDPGEDGRSGRTRERRAACALRGALGADVVADGRLAPRARAERIPSLARLRRASGPPNPRRLLKIYLDDHHAVLTAGCELVRRMLGEAGGPGRRRFLGELLPELRDDREAATQVVRSLGLAPNRFKQPLAWAGEKAGRLKLNGALTGRSPLSRLLE